MTDTTTPPMVGPGAVLLRRAATLIRQRVKAISAIDHGPWHVAEWYDGNFDKDCETKNADLCSRTGAITAHGQLPRPVVELIALLGPPAALAVADWLDAEADCQEACYAAALGVQGLVAAATGEGHDIRVAGSTLDQALALARLILGEAT
jgi:hypothetical protein